MQTPAEIRVPAQLAELDRLRSAAAAWAGAAGLSRERVCEMELVLEEAFVNVCSHAYPGLRGDVGLRFAADESAFTLEITDSGVDFDPTAREEPELGGGIQERSIGGLGIRLIRRLADRVEHERCAGRNTLRLVFLRGAAAS